MTEENTELTARAFSLVEEWLTIPDIAETFGLKVTRVHNMISDRALLALKDPKDQVRKVPALFIREDRPLESLRGTLTVLSDAGFSDEESLIWLYTDDDSLPGRPIDALLAGRKTEIRRRAQAMAW